MCNIPALPAYKLFSKNCFAFCLLFCLCPYRHHGLGLSNTRYSKCMTFPNTHPSFMSRESNYILDGCRSKHFIKSGAVREKKSTSQPGQCWHCPSLILLNVFCFSLDQAHIGHLPAPLPSLDWLSVLLWNHCFDACVCVSQTVFEKEKKITLFEFSLPPTPPDFAWSAARPLWLYAMTRIYL